MHFKEEIEQEETGQNQKEYSKAERKHACSSTPESSDRHSKREDDSDSPKKKDHNPTSYLISTQKFLRFYNER